MTVDKNHVSFKKIFAKNTHSLTKLLAYVNISNYP